ncbi:MAG: Hsp20/alpha crystallin family protein [Chloroflexi bacterium]|nr:Hsp20/alpha crystallin family protein [Chloroflexota bacterium]
MAEKTTAPVKQNAQELRRRDPFDLFEDIQQEMARFWNEAWPFAIRPFNAPVHRAATTPSAWAPRMDVYEKNGNLVIKTELPGVKPEDIDVTLDGTDLVIRGERKTEQEVKDQDYYRMERSYGSFYRCLPLPFDVAPDKIEATFNEGVLELRIPKPAEQKSTSQKISIAAK